MSGPSGLVDLPGYHRVDGRWLAVRVCGRYEAHAGHVIPQRLTGAEPGWCPGVPA